MSEREQPTKKAGRIFLISPVRGIIDGQDPELKEKLEKYVAGLEAEGYKVHWPLRDTNQTDVSGGLIICRTNFRAIIDADEIHIWYDDTSKGSAFDMGGVFMLCEMLGKKKKIVIANDKEMAEKTRKQGVLFPKSFYQVFKYLGGVY